MKLAPRDAGSKAGRIHLVTWVCGASGRITLDQSEARSLADMLNNAARLADDDEAAA